MSTAIVTKTQKRKNERFRFGLTFDKEKVDFLVHRNPIGNYLVFGRVVEAFEKGFTLVTPKTKKEVDFNAEFQELYKSMKIDHMKAISYELAHGKSLMTITATDTNKPVLRAFDISKYQIDYDDDFNIRWANTTEIIGGRSSRTVITNFGEMQGYGNIDDVYEILIRESETKGRGISYIEPIFDLLFALSMLAEHATYFVIRVGGGLKIVKIPESKMNDSAFMANMRTMVSNVNSGNGVMFLPSFSLSGLKTDTEFDLASGSQIDFTAIQELLFNELSIYTRISRDGLIGAQKGMKSSETNNEQDNETNQEMQKAYENSFRWIIDSIGKSKGWGDYEIDHSVKKVQSEQEIVEATNLIVDTVSKAGYKVSMEWLAAKLKVKLEEKEIDPLGINPQMVNGTPEQPEDTEETEEEDEQEED